MARCFVHLKEGVILAMLPDSHPILLPQEAELCTGNRGDTGGAGGHNHWTPAQDTSTLLQQRRSVTSRQDILEPSSGFGYSWLFEFLQGLSYLGIASSSKTLESTKLA